MLHIAICDDDQFYIDKLACLIQANLRERKIEEYMIDSYASATELCDNAGSYDVIFLDINMPEVNGIQAAEKIRAMRPEVLLVFVTAFMDFVLQGYRVKAIRFLVKDMLEEMLPECMEAIAKELALQIDKVCFDFCEGKRELFIKDISYIESRKHKCFFTVGEEAYSLYEKLDNLESELRPYSFLRVHKSFLVNVSYIEEISGYRVKMKNGKELPIPREKYTKVRARFYEIKGDLL